MFITCISNISTFVLQILLMNNFLHFDDANLCESGILWFHIIIGYINRAYISLYCVMLIVRIVLCAVFIVCSHLLCKIKLDFCGGKHEGLLFSRNSFPKFLLWKFEKATIMKFESQTCANLSFNAR